MEACWLVCIKFNQHTWNATSNCSQGTGSASGHALQAAISL
jgi:hypothetical protein